MGKSKKQKLDIYLEQNRSGKLKKIKIYKDKDNEDTTLSFFVSPRPKDDEERQYIKVGEYIFKEDQTLPDPTDPPVEDKPPVITGPHDIVARAGTPTTIELQVSDDTGIKSIQWRQTMPVDKVLEEFADKETAVITYEEDADVMIMVTAIDNAGQEATHGINVHVRTTPIPQPSTFKPLVGLGGDLDDDTDGVKSITILGKMSPSSIFGGDGPYGDTAGKFIETWSAKISQEHTLAGFKGNHDDAQEDGTAQVEEAMEKFFGWDKVEGKLSLSVTKVNQIGFIGMDSQDPDLENADGKQYKFVKAGLQILKDDPEIKFIMLGIHKPFYGTGYKHGDLKDARKLYQPLFDQFGVDVVFQFHNHQCWETFPVKTGAKVTHGAGADFDYDFSGDHGQVYWGCGAGGRGLYKIGSPVPIFIAKYNDKDHAICLVEVDENDPLKIRIRNVTHSDQTINSTIIRKRPSDTGPRPPVIDVGEMANTTGNVNQEHQLAVSVTDPDGNDTIASITWVQDESDQFKVDKMNISEDGWSMIFKPTEAGLYHFDVIAKDTSQLDARATLTVTIRPEGEEPPEEPTDGMVKIWDSQEGFKGPRRLVEDIEGDQSVPDSGYKRMNASGHPRLDILGDEKEQHAILITDPKDDGSESFGRWYLGKKNFNVMMRRMVRFITESAITDSSKLNARHQFRDYCMEVLGMSKDEADNIPDKKVQGGLGFHVKRNEAGFKIEVVHGTSGNGKDVKLPFTIKTGEYYNTQYWIWHTEDNKLLVEHQIEYPIGSGYKTMINESFDAPEQFHNQAEFDEWSEAWIGRLNGKGGKIEYGRIELFKLLKKPEHMKE